MLEVVRERVVGTGCEELSANAMVCTFSLPLAGLLVVKLLTDEFDFARTDKSILPHKDTVIIMAAATTMAILRRRK